MNVRPAQPEDWPAVATLLAELGRPAVVGPDAEKHRAAFAAYLAREDASAFVAESGDVIVGFVDVEFRQRLNRLEPGAWIPELIVTKAQRSRGAGAALLKAAERAGRERACRWIELESGTWRTRAHAFYVRDGWTEVSKGFVKPLGGQELAMPPVE